MPARSSLPRSVRRIDHTWIPLSDGTRLAARIWLPEDADEHPVPAILELLPYRKGDAFAARDSHPSPLPRRPRLRRRAHRPARERRLRRDPARPPCVHCSSALGRGAWRTRVETDSHMSATAARFLVTHQLDAYEGDERVYARSWSLSFPRDGV